MINSSHLLRNKELVDLLNSIKPDDCPGKVNLHCHTLLSDGSLSPEDLIEQASIKGIKYIAVTDHHNFHAYTRIDKWLKDNISSTKIYTGIEISCLLSNCLVHVLGLGFIVNHPSLKLYSLGYSQTGASLQASAVVESIHRAGGLAVLAHPARYRLDHKYLISEAFKLGFDGAEAWYDYEHNTIWKYSDFVCNQIHNQLDSLGMLSTCGTDSHGLDLFGR